MKVFSLSNKCLKLLRIKAFLTFMACASILSSPGTAINVKNDIGEEAYFYLFINARKPNNAQKPDTPNAPNLLVLKESRKISPGKTGTYDISSRLSALKERIDDGVSITFSAWDRDKRHLGCWENVLLL